MATPLARLRITIKVLIAPIVTATMMASLWLLAWGGLHNQANVIEEMVEAELRATSQAAQLIQEVSQVQSNLFRMVVWQEINRKQEVLTEVNDNLKTRIERINPLLDRLRGSLDRVEDEISVPGAAVQNYVNQARNSRRAAFGHPEFANSMMVTTARIYDSLIDKLQDMQTSIEQQGERRAERVAQDADRLSQILAAVVIGDLVIALTITWLVSRHIANGIRNTTRDMTRLAGGDTDLALKESFRRDEIGEMVRALIVFRDAELQRRQLEEERVEAEKMASLGGLVAGVAHEINTPVGVGLTAVTHIQERGRKIQNSIDQNTLKKSELKSFIQEFSDSAEIIRKNLKRASDLVQSFKTVAADQTEEDRRNFDLAQYANEVLESLRPKIKRAPVTVSNEIPAEIFLNNFPGPLGQVITNLVVNAVNHAFDQETGGTITLKAVGHDPNETEPLTLADGTQLDDPGLDKAFVALSICDDGRGIPEDAREKVFEPFYSTARNEGGTGLGLHLVYNIVRRQLGGRLRLRSSEGSGTCFDILIPVDAPRDETQSE